MHAALPDPNSCDQDFVVVSLAAPGHVAVHLASPAAQQYDGIQACLSSESRLLRREIAACIGD